MPIEELRAKSEHLRLQADKMMAETGIMELIAKHGEFTGIGGSYQYNLMIHPDLDVGILVPQADRRLVGQLLTDIFQNEAVRFAGSVDLTKFRDLSRHADKRPFGYHVGIVVPYDGEKWNIDCWVQQPEWQQSSEKDGGYAARLATLDQAGRDAVLLLKQQLIERGEYGGKYTSGDVYDAVLHGARSLAEFERYKAE